MSNQKNYKANINNANKGTKGVNKDYAHKHGNRGAQLNPNRSTKQGKGK